MSAPDTAIAVAPILDALQPLVTAAVSAFVAGIIGIVITLYNNWRWKGSQISSAQAKTIEDAASNEAAKIVAGADTAVFGNAKLSVSSPVVVAAANNILGANAANLKGALVATGATQDLVASLVTGEIGRLQARIVGGAPAVAAATPAGAAPVLAPAPAA
jgi:hypothetical protein